MRASAPSPGQETQRERKMLQLLSQERSLAALIHYVFCRLRTFSVHRHSALCSFLLAGPKHCNFMHTAATDRPAEPASERVTELRLSASLSREALCACWLPGEFLSPTSEATFTLCGAIFSARALAASIKMEKLAPRDVWAARREFNLAHLVLKPFGLRAANFERCINLMIKKNFQFSVLSQNLWIYI
jgi:hypothetical protein